MTFKTTRLKVVSVIPSFSAGGVGTVCRYAAEEMSRKPNWHVTLLSLHDSSGESVDEESGLHLVSLGLKNNCAGSFLDWLTTNPQDIIITSDVSHIEAAFPYFPSVTRHIVQVHDSVRRYREVAIRNLAWIDGVLCVGRHIEASLRIAMDKTPFQRVLKTVHNGANFPKLQARQYDCEPIRLLFMGRIDAIKGAFDLVPILRILQKRKVNVVLNIVGGENPALRKQFFTAGLDSMVVWRGRVSHSQCYNISVDSDIFMMCSPKEPFGMVTVEAMSMGCVPIAYNTPSGSSEIIEHDKSGLLVPLGDYKAWADAIETLDSNRVYMEKLAKGAIERARKQFSSEIMAENMINVICEVLSHAENQPSQRRFEKFIDLNVSYKTRINLYQRLPEGLRCWLRNKFYSHPRLSFWLLNR